jgi:hypothetical protein
MARKAERKRMVTVTRTCQAIAMLHRNGVDMSDAPHQHLLDALLDSWDRINVILLNLLRALPEGGLEAKAIGKQSIDRGAIHEEVPEELAPRSS